MQVRFVEGGRERVLRRALQLAKTEQKPEEAELLLDGVCRAALNHCRREDVPESMEWPLAVLLARVIREGDLRPVSSVKRGDTAITYGRDGMDTGALLAPFVRLGTPERRGRHD